MLNEDKIIIDVEKENPHFKHRKKRSKIAKKISLVTPLLAIVSFLTLGFCLDAWHLGWVVFLAIPLVELILGVFTKEGKAKYVTISIVVSIIGYLILGFCLDAWHPGWLIFFIVPIVGVLVE